MKLYEHFGKDGFHTSIATSFGIDFDAYENILLARFRGAGCHNNLLIVDSGMLSFALDGASPMPAYAGKNYTVTGAKARDVFHPKIVLQLGRKKGRMFVSSANVTASGLAGNLEVAALIECAGDGTGETQLIAACWRYLERFLDKEDQAIRHQLNWMWSRTPWLRDAKPAEGIVNLADGTEAGLLTTGRPEGIAAQFAQCIGGSAVKRLIAISPYWDDKLAALSYLAERTSAADVCALMDCGQHSFPAQALEGKPQFKVHDFKRGNRFIHAKILIAQTEDADHVLFGSANCTIAAMGDGRFTGSNEEASIYRRLPRGEAPKTLGLEDVLASAPLNPAAIPDISQGDDVPLADMRQRNPGRFEYSSNVLRWWPPAGTDSGVRDLDVLDTEGAVLPIKARRQPERRDGVERFDLIASGDALAFARIHYSSGQVSAPGIILFIDALRAEVRDARSKRIDVAIAQLDGELEASLLLLDVLYEIQDAEAAERGGATRAARKAGLAARPSDDAEDDGRMLSYEEFVAGRRLRSDATPGGSSLGASYVSSVRGFLNRLLSLTDPGNPDAERDLSGALLTGDEVADAGDALESGASFDPAPQPQEQAKIDPATESRLRRARQRDNREALLDAVSFLYEDIPEKAKSKGLDSVDLLRLRAMVMIIAFAGWNGQQPANDLLQVLPPSGDLDGSWPRLIGKALFAYFGGKNPPIRTLTLDEYHDHVPEDVLEFWATCMWAVHAITLTCEQHRESATLFGSLRQMQRSMYQIAGLLPGELVDARLSRVFDGLNARFATRLQFDGTEVIKRHRQAAGNLAPAA